MSRDQIQRLKPSRKPDPIEIIARADAERAIKPNDQRRDVEGDPDLVPPVRTYAPQGLAAVVDSALGPVRLPALIDLYAALDDARVRADAELDPTLGSVVTAVLEEEQAKILRYLDLRNT